MAYIGIGFVLIINGFILFLGISTQAFRMPFDFGTFSTLAGALFILLGILLVFHGFKYERIKRDRMNNESTKNAKDEP